MSEANPPSDQPRARRAFAWRTAAYLALWIVLMGIEPVDVVVGAITAALAAWVSLRLWPPESLRLRPLAMLGLLPHFLWQSVIAGVDVARRAFSPRMRLAPGFITYRPRFAPGPARNAFTAYTSLLPGTVPCGDEDGAVVYHCLDVGQPVAEQLAAEEAHLARCLAQGTERDG
jgi:multicomponent Na+:H+ antiporter subunit E